MQTTRDRRPGGAARLLAGASVAVVIGLGLQQITVSGQSARERMSGVLADLASAVPQNRALVTGRAVQGEWSRESLPKSVQDSLQGRRMRINTASEVQVYILAEDINPANLQQLAAAGATIEIVDGAGRRVQARIPVVRLDAVARLPFVNFIRLPTYAVRHAGSVMTEGDAILHSDAVRQQFSLDGTGVRVGVISDGLKGVFATGCTTCSGSSSGPIPTGDLPSATGTRNAAGVLTASSGGITGRSFQANGDLEGLPPARTGCAFPGAGAEGTALLEVVHDLAPNAQLAFANADTDLAFSQAVNYLAASNDVVMDDIGFYGMAYDGTSPVSSNTASALNNGSNRIRAYITAAGNGADEHYIGSYVDSGVDGRSFSGLTTSGHVHLFQQSADTTDVLGLGPQPYNVIKLPQNGEVVAFLTWDDPFGGSSNNYDLYLVNGTTGAVVAKSTDAQNGKQDPMEALDYVNTGGGGEFRFVIQNVGNLAQPKQLNLYSFQPQCAADGPRLLAAGHHERHNYNTAAYSVGAQNDAGGSPVSVIAVGAICSASSAAIGAFAGSISPDESCLDPSHSTIEFFSSRGPTIDGRLKPDISAIDGVSITGAGGFGSPFFGTSAATPHVAGIAALLLQAAPCLMSGTSGSVDPDTARARLRDLLVGNAVGLASPVPNNTFGSGRADALTAAQKTLPAFTGPPTVTVSGNTPNGASITAGQLGFTDPNQCPLTRMNWSGGCGTSPDTTMNCPFGTTRVSVSASSNGQSYSESANVQVTVTNFGLSVAPGSASVPAGQSATFQVTVSPQGGPYNGAITLGCTNLPQQAFCTFNPPTVSPGTAVARSTLTISTTARAVTPPPNASPRPQDPGWHRTAPRLPLVFLALAVLLAAGGFSAARRHRVVAACAASLALALIAAELACGGSKSNNQTPPPAPAASLAPASLTFSGLPVQTTSAPQTVTLTNTGTAALSLSGIAASGDFAQTNTCGASVAAGAACAINVTFTPSAVGSRTGALTITDNAANSPQTVGLSGTGLQPGTPAGTYQISVAGTAGTLVQAGAVTLDVK